ncbi:uncharacterized protein LOC128984513 [Macrosteles quadrilineatus]|uniref:uncharacterized protein LOC128984513 n=1 Tax=Macrosteles quadrilineatus TaxID=74068 RepID=UPI0023E0D643|nr:uncharacterized protein LOC128984513 [Macrosteles quadrilineatus]
MEKFLRPDELQIDPESPTASEEWTHWLQTFEDFLTMTEFVEDKDKLKLLTNRLSFTTYKFIKESETYQDALRVLNSIYIKQKNEIFSRYLVMTRKQQQGETIDKYVSELKLLSQDCVFEAVNAIQYRDHYIRDAFINGLASSYIRQRLFENKTLDLAEAVEQSRAFEMAQAQVESYPKSMYGMQTCATNELAKRACQYEFPLQQKEEATVSAIKNVDGKCYFCGHDRHSRDCCPAREATCGKCNKTGHYARVYLCTDVLIGHDITKLHSNIQGWFGGKKPPLLVCSCAKVEPPKLFCNLTPDCKPIATKSRRYSDEDVQFIKQEMERLQTEEIIEPSSSPWRAQVLVVTNDKGKKRLCVDYSQTINKFTLLDAYPLPNIDDLVSTVATNKVFSAIDLKQAYYQIPISDEEKKYTAFEATGRLFQFRRIPFGVTNGVACFQKTMDQIIRKEKLNGVYAYLDDLTVCGKDQKDHDENLRTFLDATLAFYNVTLPKDYSISRCRSSTTTI